MSRLRVIRQSYEFLLRISSYVSQILIKRPSNLATSSYKDFYQKSLPICKISGVEFNYHMIRQISYDTTIM